jgi:hypothetical protein
MLWIEQAGPTINATGSIVSQSHRHSQPTETPAAEAATVAWLVSVMMAALLEVLAAGAHIYMATAGPTEQRVLLANYALYTAAATGLISLLLAAATLKLRTEQPPPKVTAFSLVVAVAPLVAILLATLSG